MNRNINLDNNDSNRIESRNNLENLEITDRTDQSDQSDQIEEESQNVHKFVRDGEEIKIFLPRFEIDVGTMKQIHQITGHKILKNVRFMPDCHRGVGCCVGLTGQIMDKVIPRYVGVDIGCGISTYPMNVKLKRRKIPKVERLIKELVPMGCGRGGIHRSIQLRDEDWVWLVTKSQEQIDKLKDIKQEEYPNYVFPEIDIEWIHQMIKKIRGEPKRILCSAGTLGGGNHYVEVNEDDNENCYLTVHSGSRSLGFKVCKYHQNIINNNCKFDWMEFRRRMKEIKRHIKASDELLKAETQVKEQMYSELHPKYLEGTEMLDYLVDMIVSQNFATLNRNMMIRSVIINLGYDWDPKRIIETLHNYIDMDRFMIRKGSISANEGELCIISLNMRDGILLCRGKGNPDWNYSSAHGCGRVLNRQKASSNLKMKDFVKSMEDVYSTSVRVETLDESPMAYRDVELVKECLKDSVDIIQQLRPIINCKGW